MHRIAATMTSHGELRSWGCSCIHNTSVLISNSHVGSLNIPEEGSLHRSMDNCYGDHMVPHADSVFLSSQAAGSPVSWNAFSSCKPHYTSWLLPEQAFCPATVDCCYEDHKVPGALAGILSSPAVDSPAPSYAFVIFRSHGF